MLFLKDPKTQAIRSKKKKELLMENPTWRVWDLPEHHALELLGAVWAACEVSIRPVVLVIIFLFILIISFL